MTAQKSSTPAGSRDAKRARFAGDHSPRSQKGQRGASPLVLVAGLLIALVLIGGALIVVPRLSAGAADRASPSSGESQSAGAQQGSAAAVATANPAAAAPALGSDPATASQVAATAGHDPYPLVVAEDGAVRLPLSTFDDDKAHFYTYMVNGRPVEHFVVKSQDGVIHAAFNACDVCFPAHLGYHQKGDEMVCNNCGRHFPTDQINQVHGGCNPSSLKGIVLGDALIILDTDLAQGLSYF